MYQWRDTKNIEPRVNRAGRKRVLSDSQRKRLDDLVRSTPNLTLEQLRDKINASCCTVTIWHEVRRLGHTYKKTVARRGAATSDVQRSRKDWIRTSRRINFRKLVFLDETGAKTNMTRLYGWGPKSVRLTEPVPHGHGIRQRWFRPLITRDVEPR